MNNLNRQFKSVLYNVARLMPRGKKKYIYSIINLLSLYATLNLFIFFTKSKYLLLVRSKISIFFSYMFSDAKVTIAFLVIIFLGNYILIKRKNREFNTVVSLLHLGIIVLAFLPMVV